MCGPRHLVIRVTRQAVSRILFVSENRAADIAEAALSTGARRYIVKSDASRELLSAIKAVLEDKKFISSFFRTPTCVIINQRSVRPPVGFDSGPSRPQGTRSSSDDLNLSVISILRSEYSG